jgi:hypothetical protein
MIETFTHDSNLIGLPIAWLAGVPVRIATHRGVIERFPVWRLKLAADGGWVLLMCWLHSGLDDKLQKVSMPVEFSHSEWSDAVRYRICGL